MTREPITLDRWAREHALPIIREEHRVAHDSYKDPARPRACSPECEPYLEALRAFRRATRRRRRR